jgi:hypothetical protein
MPADTPSIRGTSPGFPWPYFYDFNLNKFLFYFIGTSNSRVFATRENPPRFLFY